MDEHRLRLERDLRRLGAMTAIELATSLGVSRPTVTRLLSSLRGRGVRQLGKARATRYAMGRNITGIGSSWPLYVIDPDGRAHMVGHLHALEAGQWHLQQESPWVSLHRDEFRGGLYPGLPWFLDDLRPAGFLGRAFARSYGSALGLWADPRDWDSDGVVSVLVRYGRDLQGSFVLGGDMLSSVQESMLADADTLPAASRARAYPTQAEAALADEWPGSSAAGEQPKFTTCIRGKGDTAYHAIVKFSGGEGRARDERWADLLRAEHAAAVVLAEGGVPAANAELVQGGGRLFLESERFDRVGIRGRRGLVSLAALDSAFLGQADTTWADAAQRLEDAGWLDAEDAARLKLLHWFGVLIGNTDMHYGNIGLFLEPDLPLSLAPAYDMLPMLYRPDSEGRLPDRDFGPSPPPPEAIETWSIAADLAVAFWSRVANDRHVSGQFRRIAEENGEIVERHRHQFGA